MRKKRATSQTNSRKKMQPLEACQKAALQEFTNERAARDVHCFHRLHLVKAPLGSLLKMKKNYLSN